MDRVMAKIRSAGGDAKAIVTAIPAHVWRMSWSIVADSSGHSAIMHLARCPNRALAGGVLKAAMNRGRYSWASMRARRICALGLVYGALAKSTARRGPWGSLVMGFTRGAFAALLRDPMDPDHERGTPALSTVFGVHRTDGTPENGEAGYFQALRDAGVVYRQQLPKGEAYACETYGPSGYATNRYWLVARDAEAVRDTELRMAIFGLQRDANAAREAWRAAGRLGRGGPPPATAAPPT